MRKTTKREEGEGGKRNPKHDENRSKHNLPKQKKPGGEWKKDEHPRDCSFGEIEKKILTKTNEGGATVKKTGETGWRFPTGRGGGPPYASSTNGAKEKAFPGGRNKKEGVELKGS